MDVKASKKEMIVIEISYNDFIAISNEVAINFNSGHAESVEKIREFVNAIHAVLKP